MTYKTKKAGSKAKTTISKGIDSIYGEVAPGLEKQLAGMVEGRQPGDFHTPFEFKVQLDAKDVDTFKGDANEGLTKIAKDLRIKSAPILTRLTEKPVNPKQLKTMEENLLAKAAKVYEGKPADLEKAEQTIRSAMDVLWTFHNQKSIEMGNKLGTKKFFWKALDAAVQNFKSLARRRAGEPGYSISKAELQRLTDAEIKEGILLTSARNMMEASLRAEGMDDAWLRLSKRIRVVAGQSKYEEVRGALMSTETFTKSKNIRDLLKNCGLNQAQVTEILGADSLSATGAIVKSVSTGKRGFALALSKKQIALLNSAVGVNLPAAKGDLRPSGPVLEALRKLWRTSGAINLANAWGGGKFLYSKYLRNAIKRGTFEPPTMAAREYMYRSRAGITGFFRKHASARTVAIGYLAYRLGRGYLVPFVDYLGESFGLWEPGKTPKSLEFTTPTPVYDALKKRVEADVAEVVATMINKEDLLPVQKMRVAELVSKLDKDQITHAKNKKFMKPLVAELAKQVRDDTQYPTAILGDKPRSLSRNKRMKKILRYITEKGSAKDKAALKKEQDRLKQALKDFDEQEEEYELSTGEKDDRHKLTVVDQVSELEVWADKYVEKYVKPKSDSPEKMAGILAQFGAEAEAIAKAEAEAKAKLGTKPKPQVKITWVWHALGPEKVAGFAHLANTVKGLSAAPRAKANFLSEVFKYVRKKKREDFIKDAIVAQKMGKKLSGMILELPAEKYISADNHDKSYMTIAWFKEPFSVFVEKGIIGRNESFAETLSHRIKALPIHWIKKEAPMSFEDVDLGARSVPWPEVRDALITKERKQLASSLAYLYSRTTGQIPATPKYEADLKFLIGLRKDGLSFSEINNYLTASIRTTPKDRKGKKPTGLSFYQKDVEFLRAAGAKGHFPSAVEAILGVFKEDHGALWSSVRVPIVIDSLGEPKELKRFGQAKKQIDALFKSQKQRKKFTHFARENMVDPQLVNIFKPHRKLYDVLPVKTAEWVSMQLMGKNKVGRQAYNKALPLEYHEAVAETIVALQKEKKTGMKVSLPRIQGLYPIISQLAPLSLAPKKKAAICLGIIEAYNPALQKLKRMRSRQSAEYFRAFVFEREYLSQYIEKYIKKNPNATAAELESQAGAYVYVLSKFADPQFLKKKKIGRKIEKQLALLSKMETYLLGKKNPTTADVDKQF